MNIIIAAVIAVVLAFGGGYYKGHSSGFAAGKAVVQADFDTYKAEQEKKYTDTVLKYRDREQAMQETAAAEQEKHREKVRSIDSRLSAALVELRNRPERRTPDTQVPRSAEACVGVSGAELARGDAEFLARYAADAKKQREALRICETQYEQVRAELNKE
jgi:hypothetical protein